MIATVCLGRSDDVEHEESVWREIGLRNSGKIAMMSSKGGKRNGSEQAKENLQGLHVKLDRRILAALKRESEARGGRQEQRITEEALTVYLGLKVLPQTNGFTGSPEIAARRGNTYKYSRIVE